MSVPNRFQFLLLLPETMAFFVRKSILFTILVVGIVTFAILKNESYNIYDTQQHTQNQEQKNSTGEAFSNHTNEYDTQPYQPTIHQEQHDSRIDDTTDFNNKNNNKYDTTKTNFKQLLSYYNSMVAPYQVAMLPLTDWELASTSEDPNKKKCNPPYQITLDDDNNGGFLFKRKRKQIPQICCLGSSSAGGDIIFDYNTCRLSSETHQLVVNYTKEYYYKTQSPDPYNEVQQNQSLTTTTSQKNNDTASTSSSTTSSSVPFSLQLPRQDCDVCRIIDYLILFNWTLSFQGDSMSRQVFRGFECELFRRGYIMDEGDHDQYPDGMKPYVNRSEETFWKLGLTSTRTIQISWMNTGNDNNNNDDDTDNSTDSIPQNVSIPKATINFFDLYRPLEDNDNAEIRNLIIANSDIVVFDHGVHWTNEQQYEYKQSMYKLLHAYFHSSPDAHNPTAEVDNNHQKNNDPLTQKNVPQNRLKLVAWRETSSQHFDTPEGEFVDDERNVTYRPCVPHNDQTNSTETNAYNSSISFRYQLMVQAAAMNNVTVLSTDQPNFMTIPPPSSLSSQQPLLDQINNKDDDGGGGHYYYDNKELIILPYKQYTSKLHYLHPWSLDPKYLSNLDCTHFCNNPYIYVPVWKSLRLALDRRVNYEMMLLV